ncbi:MAG: Fur family transcriptional regulator [Micropruina sp.]|uniref:Fur family transcriptional regulator n=1 Tax=Micropruina sp. TaxID=2737536 RepID=UPI0039E707B6
MVTPTRRGTPQQDAVIALLAAADHFLSARMIRDELAGSDRPVSLATVYRTLRELTEARTVDRVHSATGETLYHLRDRVDGGYLVCRSCGVAVPISTESTRSRAAVVATARGFTDVVVTVDVTAVCPDCSA